MCPLLQADAELKQLHVNEDQMTEGLLCLECVLLNT